VLNELELEGIRSLVAEGQTIEAIKLVRERTGLGLAEAKDLVERLAEG
jgi:ribosomal protein L7/L12